MSLDFWIGVIFGCIASGFTGWLIYRRVLGRTQDDVLCRLRRLRDDLEKQLAEALQSEARTKQRLETLRREVNEREAVARMEIGSA
ncbi:hypothetical protein LCGC14_1791400 [marine sediment metagenome]|uniref:Uncharacterized protein n=1 Tax=marine sediment metagenome TaxID=412755 RepID=A0A0F9JS08_9ZZZZ